MRRVFSFFLIILSCSKDKEPAQYLLKSYDIIVDSSEGGSVSYEGGSLGAGSSLTINAHPIMDVDLQVGQEMPQEVKILLH